MNQDFRDRDLSLLGRSRTRNGREELTDANGSLQGSYRASSDTTVDRNGRLVGRGNQLAEMLRKR